MTRRNTLTLSVQEYLSLFPDTPRHMVKSSGGAILQSGFFPAGKGVGWPPYEGDYLHYQIIDIRQYLFTGWEKYELTPFRLFVTGYDDWSVESLFETLEEAETSLDSVSQGRLTSNDWKSNGFKGI